jgi:hypothetical protein
VSRPLTAADLERPEGLRATFRDPARQAAMERYGYVLGPRLDADLLEAVRAAQHRLGHAPDDPGLAINWSFHSRSAAYKHAVKAELMSLFGPWLDRLLDDHVPYLATFITKWPGEGSSFAPHQDPTLVDERSYRGITIWIPLEDTVGGPGGDNGMLHVVPGSHRFSRAPRVQDVDSFEFAPFEQAIIERHGRPVPTRAGDVLVFDNRLIHYSWPNETPRPRVVVSFTVRPRETTPVLLRRADDGLIELFRIWDDFYIDTLPAEQHLWQPAEPPAARLDPGREPLDAAEFDRLCGLTPDAPHCLPNPNRPLSGWRDPGAFCHLCGSRDGLADADREGRNNAQLVCDRCAGQLRVAAGEG